MEPDLVLNNRAWTLVTKALRHLSSSCCAPWVTLCFRTFPSSCASTAGTNLFPFRAGEVTYGLSQGGRKCQRTHSYSWGGEKKWNWGTLPQSIDVPHEGMLLAFEVTGRLLTPACTAAFTGCYSAGWRELEKVANEVFSLVWVMTITE